MNAIQLLGNKAFLLLLYRFQIIVDLLSPSLADIPAISKWGNENLGQLRLHPHSKPYVAFREKMTMSVLSFFLHFLVIAPLLIIFLGSSECRVLGKGPFLSNAVRESAISFFYHFLDVRVLSQSVHVF